jgi:hypothetical protein
MNSFVMSRSRLSFFALLLIFGFAAFPAKSFAQGWMPVRFDLPRVAGSTRPQLMAHEWQIDFAYRRLSADQWYVGTRVNESAGVRRLANVWLFQTAPYWQSLPIVI